ncbi:MAG: prephenate dehydrogenase/arogenate dehydrogenase family protein [Spirochaetes bacterium]|nr:MAG: prephenate dehydrogenase/arogenate dehydrogenase family protein [Spirochaetota bacterium]
MEVGVYGLGRFGYLWAEILSKKFTVKGFNRSGERKTPQGVIRVSEEELLHCDTIFLCVTISSMEDVLKRISVKIKEHTLVMDTCSVKVYPARIMRDLLPENVNIIGTHPMFGPDSVKHGLEHLPMVLSPVRAEEYQIEYWRGVFHDLGLKVLILTPEEHDREAAYTQGITHFIGRVLEDLKLTESRIGTLGFKKILEVIEQTCNDPWQLFLDLQRYNPYTEEMRRNLNISLQKIMDKLKTDA